MPNAVEYNPVYISSIQKRPKNALLLIGPEGDFSEKEKERLVALQSTPVVLSLNRLRTETAAIAFTANITSHFAYLSTLSKAKKKVTSK